MSEFTKHFHLCYFLSCVLAGPGSQAPCHPPAPASHAWDTALRLSVRWLCPACLQADASLQIHLPVLLPLMRRVSQIARLSQRGLKDSASSCEHERVKENKKTCWSGKERLIFFPCYILILYILLKFYFCMFYFMYHFGNVCCCCCCCCSTNTVCL